MQKKRFVDFRLNYFVLKNIFINTLIWFVQRLKEAEIEKIRLSTRPFPGPFGPFPGIPGGHPFVSFNGNIAAAAAAAAAAIACNQTPNNKTGQPTTPANNQTANNLNSVTSQHANASMFGSFNGTYGSPSMMTPPLSSTTSSSSGGQSSQTTNSSSGNENSSNANNSSNSQSSSSSSQSPNQHSLTSPPIPNSKTLKT